MDGASDSRRLTLVRALHTLIYVIMASAVFVVLYAGVTDAHGPWLWIALGLVAIESVVFAANGLKCPLTAIVTRYSAGAEISDTFFPASITRYTFAVFGPLILLGVALLAWRWLAA